MERYSGALLVVYDVYVVVKHLLSTVSNFCRFKKMTNWSILILAFMIYHGSR